MISASLSTEPFEYYYSIKSCRVLISTVCAVPFNKLSLFPQIFKSGLHQVNVKTLSIAAVGSFPQKELRRGRPASASDRCGGLEQYLQGVAWSYLPPPDFQLLVGLH